MSDPVCSGCGKAARYIGGMCPTCQLKADVAEREAINARLPDGWTARKSDDGWWDIRDDTGAPACEGQTEGEAIEAAWEVYRDTTG